MELRIVGGQTKSLPGDANNKSLSGSDSGDGIWFLVGTIALSVPRIPGILRRPLSLSKTGALNDSRYPLTFLQGFLYPPYRPGHIQYRENFVLFFSNSKTKKLTFFLTYEEFSD